MALKIYKKKLNYSYTLGIFPTIELLKNKPEQCTTMLISSKARELKGIQQIRALCKKHEINLDVADKAINKLAIKDKTQVIGVFKKYPANLEKSKDHVVLVNPSLPGNMGTIIRTMVGFEINNLAIIEPASDFFDPKVIRASMGAGFHTNYQYFSNFEEYQKKFPENTVYPFILEGKTNLSEVEFKSPTSLVFGNEGSGLDSSFVEFDNTVTIDHSKDIESLNLSAAVGISLFKLFNQKAQQ